MVVRNFLLDEVNETFLVVDVMYIYLTCKSTESMLSVGLVLHSSVKSSREDWLLEAAAFGDSLAYF